VPEFAGVRINFEAETEQQRIQRALQQHTADLHYAWRAWQLYSCVEFNGDHDMRLRLEMGDVSVVCANCPADVDDFMPDGREMLTSDIPVSISVRVEKYHSYEYPDECDVWVDLEERR
jgi:hypothetical protein